MSGVVKSLAGTASGLCVEYREILTPNSSPRFWNGKLVAPTLITMHTAECGEVADGAENLATWGASANRPKASWTFAVANADITMSVPLNRLAWHAGPINPYSVGIELVGRAAQTADQWHDQYSNEQRTLASMLVAVLCESLQIPVRRVTPEELKRNHLAGIQSRGICGHADVTKALGGTHTDPGPCFPWDEFLEMVHNRAVGAPDD